MDHIAEFYEIFIEEEIKMQSSEQSYLKARTSFMANIFFFLYKLLDENWW